MLLGRNFKYGYRRTTYLFKYLKVPRYVVRVPLRSAVLRPPQCCAAFRGECQVGDRALATVAPPL